MDKDGVLLMFIAWYNENEGFFSLILSIIAIVISIIAINAQNKGVVFENDLNCMSMQIEFSSRARRLQNVVKGDQLQAK